MNRVINDLRSSIFPSERFTGPLGLDEYQLFAKLTDKSRVGGVEKSQFLLLGLFGEVGSLLSELKKKQRDRNAYLAYAQSAQEELGDVLWYYANLATHLGLRLTELAAQAATDHGPGYQGLRSSVRLFRDLQQQGRLFSEPAAGPNVEASLLRLAVRTGRLVEALQTRGPSQDEANIKHNFIDLFRYLVSSADDAEVSLEESAAFNIEKTLSRWPVKRDWGLLYDQEFDLEEQLPRTLEITFKEKTVGGKAFVIQSSRDVNIGDRLTDNRPDPDDYRFHDVFHLSYAAILGWSPVLRALLKVKRKSDVRVDEQEDGARATITEEGISNWIFAHGLRHQAFEGVDNLDFALLKTIREMVKGYEVENRPLWMWEHAILEGFRVFRELKRHRGGTVTANLIDRSLTYKTPQQGQVGRAQRAHADRSTA
jgi:NTP pyrophosphatase (non-canonical NTP hydrolase)